MSVFLSFVAIISLALASLSPQASAAGVAENGSSTAGRPTIGNYQRQFLQAHNEARAAAGLPPLTWNMTLQLDSKRYANELRIRCSTRPLYAWGTDGIYGRNLYKGTDKRRTPAEAVAAWVSEGHWYDLKNNRCTAPEDQSCDEYKQVVWRATTQVGCGRHFCRASFNTTVAVCEYYPPGNRNGQRPY
ncbi:hypothetical protein GQ55_7G079800 [Panicum hallii var. hallii]|uniref:SCP domain-containing protein n=1 Tax=Panicum hallii var. hallii TaxID=1504633 RepID=A0A2T7CT80_9POAL|nr:hypothetical protein GQ55_7G079800 [Panicum hallii var. hallii]